MMSITLADKRITFRKLHEAGCFVLPNPFDVGSALALQHLGFKALASTSAGFAWTIGKADNRVTVDDVCKTSHRTLCSRRSDGRRVRRRGGSTGQLLRLQ
jgi:2-methylisocitrate lyase-like PEP mutase family enzyme